MSDSDDVLSRIEKDIKDFGVEKNEEPGLQRDRFMEDMRKSRDRLEEIVEERTVDLQAAKEELVAANEELMAANEELRATGEELIAANQELVAANEELAAVNEQLRLEIVLREKAEEEIKKSHQEMHSILESIKDAFFAVDQNWRFIYVNSEAERLWGRKREELTGRELWEVFPEAVDTLFQREYQRAMSHRVAVHFEGFSPVFKRWIDVHVYPFREGLSIYFRDISERRRAEEKLRLNESRLEALVRLNKMTGVTTKELTDFVVEEVVRLTGSDMGFVGTLNRDESVFTSRSRSDKAANECEIEDKPLYYALNSPGLLADVIRGRRPLVLNDYNVFHHAKKGLPNGHPPLRRIMIIPVFDGDRIVMLAGVANKKENYDDLDVLQLTLLMSGLWEILQRKKAEEELRFSNERFARSFNASPVMMTINSHADLRFIDANEAFLKGVEYTRPEVIGRTLEELDILADSEGQAEEIKSTIAEQGTLYNRELRFRTKNGDVRVGLASVDTFFINNEQCVLWVMQDITEKRQIEKDIARLERFNLVGQMAAGIGHEIRNPMTAVRGFLQLLGGRKEYADYRQYFDLMIDELDRANSIITEYLSLARNRPVDLVEIRLDSILRVLYPLIMADALNAGVNIEFKLEDVPEFPLNENEIRQLVLNLVRNGIESMPAGGMLSIHTYREGEEVVLSVRDQGGGMDEEALEKLGTPFYTTKDNGTGLGLAVCYSIAARHKAIIDVETGPDGTAFRVRFRVKEERGHTE